MRGEPTILHVDMDAFYAAVEQRDKPSLRGRPVVVGGVGPRGVVATASYEARVFGIRSAMPMVEARRRCPRAAVLAPRFGVYSRVSTAVMDVLRAVSAAVQPISLDEAFLDLAIPPAVEAPVPDGPTAAAPTAALGSDHGAVAGGSVVLDVEGVRLVAERLRAEIHAVTGGLTASVGAGTSKLIAKIASDSHKPDGLVVVAPGEELDMLDPLPVRSLWGVGPATAAHLHRIGVETVAQLRRMTEGELVGLLGRVHGRGLFALARAQDDRPVEADREIKSISVEDTFDDDLIDVLRLRRELDRLTERVVERLRRAGRSARTVTVKVRHADFTTLSRSDSLPAPTDDPTVVHGIARRLLAQIDVGGGVRLLGVGVSALADYTQGDLFAQLESVAPAGMPPTATASASALAPSPGGAPPSARQRGRWSPGQDVVHADHGPGWVQGSGLGRVTVRFETAETGPGPVRTFATDDPALTTT